MTDSPRVHAPLDPTEQPILGRLLQIRTRLELLKSDKSNYVKSDDVLSLYRELIEQVHALNDIRISKRDEQNRVDTVLDDCFQLISLAFMTIGKNSELPALYSAVSTIKRLLDHIKEAAFYSGKDLESIRQNLQEYEACVSRNKECVDPNVLTLFEARLKICQTTLAELQQVSDNITPELTPYHEKLVSILRTLSACNVRSKFPRAEVEDLHKQLREIQEALHDKSQFTDDKSLVERYAEKLASASNSVAASGQEIVSDLLTRCLIWVEIVQQRPGYIEEKFRDTYEKLLSIRNSLESKSLLQAWSMRETDLYDYQRKLDRIDESRTKDGNFIDEEGHKADLQTQRTLLYLLRKSYALIYLIMTSSEPVSEALLPIYNQLKTLKRCLREVQKAGGVTSSRDLWPYSMKLSSIDNMRVDGKFMVGGEIPEGQGALTTVMEECFEMVTDLRNQAEEASAGDNDKVADKVVDEAIDMKA